MSIQWKEHGRKELIILTRIAISKKLKIWMFIRFIVVIIYNIYKYLIIVLYT